MKNILKNLPNYYAKITDYVKNSRHIMSEGASAPGRPMKFPYTLSAKIAQFPFKHYFNNQWIWRYGAISCLICLPIFYKISKLGKFLT